MPFDAMVAVARRHPVTETLALHGLAPVPWEVLVSHKLAQHEKFGPSFWYRHRAAISLLLVMASPAVGALVGATNGFNGHAGMLAIGGSFAWLCVVAIVTGMGLIRLRAGSHWRERWVPLGLLNDLGVPQPIAEAARLLRQGLPGATLVLGELLRDEVVLDPYLLLKHGDECICLGIWEDGKVVASAG